MRIVVFGSGAREHALCWRLTQDDEPHQITCIPGNSAIGKIVKREPMECDLKKLAQKLAGRFDLAAIGPEQLLADGFADHLRLVGIPTFGPSKAAAQIESSKGFAKEIMRRFGIPTADYLVASTPDTVMRAIEELGGLPIVLKAEGLCAGKGVRIIDTQAELDEALGDYFAKRIFGDAAKTVVVEELLRGTEVSFIALINGKRAYPMACSMDYKQALAGDHGKNTGGMGAHSPSFVLGKEQANWVTINIMQRMVDGLASMGIEYRGALYAGLMVHPDGSIKVLEFNARFGDPELQVLLMRLEGELAPWLHGAAIGALPRNFLGLPRKMLFTDDVVLNTVLASSPYPDTPVIGELISGIEEAERLPGVQIFHAGTTLQGCGNYVTTGGRVLSICARAKTLAEAQKLSLQACDLISWKNKTLRRDIGWRVLNRMPKKA